MCAMVSLSMYTYIYRHRCKITKKTPSFFKWLHLIVKIYLCSGRYYLIETRNCLLLSSSDVCTLLIVCTYSAVLAYISPCSSSYMSFLIYVAMCFLGLYRGINPMWKLLYVGINPWGCCSLLMANNISFSSIYRLIPCQDLVTYYWGCIMNSQKLLLLDYLTIFVAYNLFLMVVVTWTNDFSS